MVHYSELDYGLLITEFSGDTAIPLVSLASYRKAGMLEDVGIDQTCVYPISASTLLE